MSDVTPKEDLDLTVKLGIIDRVKQSYVLVLSVLGHLFKRVQAEFRC